MKHCLISLVLLSALSTMSFCSQPVDHSKEKKVSNTQKTKHRYTNHLIDESSPYLLMHAHNPVNWYPWGQEALEKAKQENKLIIVSIGYAACHWCHVMEHESFSDEEVAELMNKHFVSIKVDREERPDIDQVYMDAAHLLTGSGGWPLNAIALADGRPIFAGTYFPKERWLMLLNKIHEAYTQQPDKIIQQAESVTQGIRQADTVVFNASEPEFPTDFAQQMVRPWQFNWDTQWGGEKRAPKFPLPIGYRFLLTYYHLAQTDKNLDRSLSDKTLKAITLTLDKMAMGGIYDQAGGGFARYSTDMQWKVPHFEKMLYDNGQLVSLYSQAYQATKNPLYKSVVFETLEFIERELMSPETPKGGRGFYSSLDADSDGEEGKFYVWTRKEFDQVVGKNAALLADYFDVTSSGNWEHGNSILFRNMTDKEFADSKKITVKQLHQAVAKARPLLLKARVKRVRPPLDDKILTAWNGLMLRGYVDAFRAFNEKNFLTRALENANFIVKNMMDDEGRLNRNYKNGKSSINAFLDDYAFAIDAFVSLYQVTFDEQWLMRAGKMLTYTVNHFFDSKSGMFYYTSDLDKKLITRKMELSDNVIPASNSQMAINLYNLGEYFYNEDWVKKSKQMLNNVKNNIISHGIYYANWGILMTYFTHARAEVAILGDDWQARRNELDQHFMPHMLLMGGKTEGNLPLLKNKLNKGETTIYVCRNKACLLPVTTTAEALKQLMPKKEK